MTQIEGGVVERGIEGRSSAASMADRNACFGASEYIGASMHGVQSRDGSGRVSAWLLGSWTSVASLKMHANVYNLS